MSPNEVLESFKENHSDGPFQTAEIYAWRGETDEAFTWLDKAYVERDSGLHEMLNDPFLTSLIGDERWPVFLKKMGLPLNRN